jgi:hypothetical protein
LAAGLPPFTLKNATKAGTMDVLLNAGPLHDEIARLARENAYGVSGSSANVSLSGSKFVLQEVQAQVRNIADIEIDYGSGVLPQREGARQHHCRPAQLRDLSGGLRL